MNEEHLPYTRDLAPAGPVSVPPPAAAHGDLTDRREQAATWLVRRSLAFAAGSLTGMVISVVGFMWMVGQQWAYDDSSGASGSQPPAVLAWFFLALLVLCILAGPVATVGASLGFDRVRRHRARRGAGAIAGALLLSVPGTAIVLIGIVSFVVWVVRA